MLAVSKTVVHGLPMSHIALALSIVCFLFVIPAIFNPKKFRDALESFMNSNDSTIRLAAFIHLLVAFLILNTHWTVKLSSSRSIMTVLGYLLLVRGVVWLWFPGFVRSMQHKFLQKDYGVYVMTALGLVFALGLGYLALWVY